MATPPSMLVLTWGAWSVGAPPVVTFGLALLAVFLGYLVLFDFPTAIEVDDTGIHRVSLLRRDTLGWEQIARIVRPRKRGLIVITKDRKRRVLIDRRLDEPELDVLREQAEQRDVSVEL